MSNLIGETISNFSDEYRMIVKEDKDSRMKCSDSNFYEGLLCRGILQANKNYAVLPNDPKVHVTPVLNGTSLLAWLKREFGTLQKGNVMARCAIIEMPLP